MPPGSAFERAEQPGSGEWQQPPIADFAFLSDCSTAALVDRAGSVVWWCLPRFDSPSVFGRLLDQDAGHWTIRPVGEFSATRTYVEGSLVLRTVFTTADGEVALTECLGLRPGARGHDIGFGSPRTLLRRVEGVRGAIPIEIQFAPRMEYGRTLPHVDVVASGAVARGGPVQLTLSSPIELDSTDGTAIGHVVVAPGDLLDFVASYEPSFGAPDADPDEPQSTVIDTLQGWQSWSDLHKSYVGRYAEMVHRSSLVLQGLTYRPSGAIIAAATTSLPERVGGDLNFDYRFAWVRDLSLTIRSLWIAACPAEPARLFDWFVNAAGRIGDGVFQIMYGVEGERELSEHVLDHLDGYRDSRPVRVGNEASSQIQLDVLGEILDAVYLLRDELGEFGAHLQELIVGVADRAAAQWSLTDAGMWESRDRGRHYVSSKVMCWVALDRAVLLADRLGPSADPQRWSVARDELWAVVVERAWSEAAGAYAGAFDSDELDASVLLLPLVGFLGADDARMRATIDVIERELAGSGLVRRWREDDSGFLICTFWLAECLAMAGELERAEAWFDTAAGYANDLGLMAEEAVGGGGPLLGNFPQAFSHVGLINAAWRIDQAHRTASHPTTGTGEADGHLDPPSAREGDGSPEQM